MALAAMYALTLNPGNGQLTVTDGTNLGPQTVVDSADGTPDGSVASGANITVNGDPTFIYTGDEFGAFGAIPLIVQDSLGNFFFLTNNTTLVAGQLVGDTDTDSGPYAVCFLAGTCIATPEGERAIETLAIGDMITLANGEQKPIKWIGQMSVDLHRFNRHTASPILIRAGALGNGLPRRDLYTSYRHGFAVDGSLVVAGVLVNGTSIVQCSDWAEETVKYYQIEVDGHQLMLAEGAASETFCEDGDNRALFDNAAEFHALYPDAAPPEPMALGRVVVARQLPRAIKARIEAAAVEIGCAKLAAAA